jgi:hypothetical protein
MRFLPALLLALCACRSDAPRSNPAVSGLPAPPPSLAPPPRVESDLDAHLRSLRARAPEGFTMVVERPFVVLGDEPAERVAERAEVVRWAVRMLKRDFFDRDPPHLLDVWLFADRESYESHTRAIFGETPSTPYGYYSHQHRALIMNIATGGGTLVHEIVHPFMAANVPGCPAWLNEGLGSLYEQSAERDGRIVGLTNWRLAGLQEAIHEGILPSFELLTALTDEEFYGAGSGLHYAQARYLLYYLQEHDRLRPFFRRYLAERAADPTAFRTLTAALAEPDMRSFQRRWESYVLGLRFP